MTNLAVIAPIVELMGTASRPVNPPNPLELEHDANDLSGHIISFDEFRYDDTPFCVSLLNGCKLPRSAAALLEQAYTRLGYTCDHAKTQIDSCVSLHATVDQDVVGTLSVTLDSPSGIQAEALYEEEIARFRPRGKICEFTRLAVDATVAGREVLCSLFYVAHVYAHLLNGATDLFIEVNPRHVRFYERMLGFRQVGEEKFCQRVNAPAVLLHLDLNYIQQQIEYARQGLAVTTGHLFKFMPIAAEETLARQIAAISRR